MDLTTAMTKLRIVINDSPTSHFVAPDNLQSQVNGTRKIFRLNNQNILTGSQYSQDGGDLTAGDSLVTNSAAGLVTMPTAPATSLEWLYYYQDFTDTEVQQFLDFGLGEVGADETALATIDAGLFTVVCHYAAAEAYDVRMARFAETFTSSVAGESYSASDIFKAYKAAHDSHLADGNAKRTAYYQKQGRNFQTYSKGATAGYKPTNLFPRR